MTYVHTAWEYKPVGVTAAQMNLFYGLAVLALRGQLTAADYTEERIADPAVLAFIGRIHPFEDAAIDSRGAAFRHAATMQVTTTAGAVLTHDIWNRRGSPENPVAREEVEAKFFANVAQRTDEGTARRIAELVRNFDTLESVDALTALL